MDIELFLADIGNDHSDNITNRISKTIDSYIINQENILKIFRASLQIIKRNQDIEIKDIILALFM